MEEKGKNIFDEIISSAKAFVEKHKGAWDHAKWEDFLSETKKKGVLLTEEMSHTIGTILESFKKLYVAHPTEEKEAEEKKPEEKAAYLQQLEDQLKQWDVKIDILHADYDKVKEEHKEQYKKDLNEVLTLYKEAEKMLEKLRESGEEEWEELKDGADKAWSDLESALEKALSFEP
jgi:signal recognition particle GTPase